MHASAQTTLATALNALADDFRAGLPERVRRITLHCTGLAAQPQPDVRERLLFELHKLAGSAASFGLNELADAARLAWSCMNEAVLRPMQPPACERVIQLLQAFACPSGPAVADGLLSLPAAPLDAFAAERNGVVLISQLATGWDMLATRLAELGRVNLHVQSGDVVAGEPELVLVDLDTSAGVSLDERMQRVRRCAGQNIPVLGISRDDSFELRLQVSQVGGLGILAMPVAPDQVLDALYGLRERRRQQPIRVLVVDDAAELAQLYQVILETAGMEVFVERDPARVMGALNRYRPELLLIDQHMPGWRGEDVAATIRSYGEFTGLPIIFLSGENDRERQLFALTHGQAEDFLVKPVAPERLVAIVLNRAMRFRALRRLMAADSLTRLYNHAAIQQELENDLARARRTRSKLAVAMIDIDHFKSVNDRYGHPAGDEVLRSLAELMRQRLRAGDSIGRYGGEEFMLLMPETDIVGAMRLLDELRLTFASLWHKAGREQFRCTFSCGVAGYPGASSASRLVELADRALYRAKSAGRNQVQVDWKQFGLGDSK